MEDSGEWETLSAQTTSHAGQSPRTYVSVHDVNSGTDLMLENGEHAMLINSFLESCGPDVCDQRRSTRTPGIS